LVTLKETSKVIALLLVLLVFTAIAEPHGDDQHADTRALLTRTKQLVDLRAEGIAPFELHAHLQATVKGKDVSGEYTLNWRSPNRWREELEIADFRRLRVGTAGGYYQLRSVDYQLQIIFDIDEVMDESKIVGVGPEETAAKPKVRRLGSVSVACVEIRRKELTAREVCLDQPTGLLVHARIPQGSSFPVHSALEADYSAFEPLGERQIARVIRLKRSDWFTMQISVTAVEPPRGSDAELFLKPEQSEFWGDCRDVTPAELVGRKMPGYPVEAKLRHEQGIVSLYARIEPDGSISHVTTVHSPSSRLAAAAQGAVMQWNYKPASCSGSPIRIETLIDVIFSLGG
jgi:hypothetical protein